MGSSSTAEPAGAKTIFDIEDDAISVARYANILEDMLEKQFSPNYKRDEADPDVLLFHIRQSVVDDFMFIAGRLHKVAHDIDRKTTEAINAFCQAERRAS